ncbi:tiggrin isoform X2 [Drosophila rhopaloa]|uniref:Tiggrin n=1 Tax=Drosophila rhopaloa TaxID=1041015 RepID=A0ABM5JD27_DRORH|nr:tiggrin isoform X2 [Drosophila rhopaloa]
MRTLEVLTLLLAAAIGQGYGSFQRSSFISSPSLSYGDGKSPQLVPQLNPWASAHFNEVRELANHLKQKFNVLSQGSTNFGFTSSWSASILELTGRSPAQLDVLSSEISQQLVADMREGITIYSTIAQPNFFEAKAAELLERYAGGESASLQQTVGLGPFQPVDLSGFDEVKNFAYPAEVKVIGGKTYVVHRNCTEATRLSGYGSSAQLNQEILRPDQTSLPLSSTTTTITRKKTIQNWVRENMEPSVVGYNSVVNVDGKLENNAFNQMASASPGASSTVEIHNFNKTITMNLDGTSSIGGSESQQRWQDGKLVFDKQQPFGHLKIPRDEEWKREERERLFWYLTTPQGLDDWQQQQEERLLGVAQRYQISLPMLKDFHRHELERYQALQVQYQPQVQDKSVWQRQERSRLDWLIHQNGFTTQDINRWQNENERKLAQTAQQHGISQNQLLQWQREELQRFYVYLNQVNESLLPQVPSVTQTTFPTSSSLSEENTMEQQRLVELIRQHNATIAALQNSIKTDQQRLKNLSIKYQGDMQSQTQWLRGEVARIGGLIKDQNEQVTKITAWQSSERNRLENILQQHRGSVGEMQQRMNRDQNYLQNLATKYQVTVEELEKWQYEELQRLQVRGQQQLEDHIKDWQASVSTNLRDIVGQNQLTIEEFQNSIINDRSHLEEMGRIYKVRVEEIEQWIKSELKKLQSEGLLKEVERELKSWQQKERERLQAIVQHNSLTVDELETKIKNDQDHFFKLADKYKISVEDIQDWLKKELLRLQSEGLVKAETLKDWQQNERAQISLLVQQNKYSLDEFERKMLTDRTRLQELSNTYNVKVSEIEQWIKSEGDRLQHEGQLRMESQLNNWQKIERQRLLDLINKNNLSIEEIELKIGKDQTHLYSLAQQHQVHVEEIERWIKQQIQKLQDQGLIEMQKLKNWQLEWRGNLTNMVQDRDFTVEEFHKWLLKDRSQLQSLAMQHNVQIEEIEQFVKKEEQRFIGMGLLKPSEKLTNWQEVERLHLKNLAQQQYKSTEQLEARLKQDRELLEGLARQYSVQVEEIENWMKQELARMRDEGQLQIDNLTSWQLAERERLETLIKQNKQWSAEELRAELEKDREHMQTMAFQYHTSVEEIEKWLHTEIERLKQQGKLNIEQLTAWQRTEQQRILSLLHQHSNITLEQFQAKVNNDRRFLIKLADQHHVHIVEVENYVKQVIEDLRKNGQFEIEQLQTWQRVERDYIKGLIAEHKNALTTAEYEEKLLADRAHLKHLADQYRLNVEQIEEWMIAELKRLRGTTEESLKSLSAWQVSELERLQNLVKEQNHLTFVEFEMELNQERERLQKLANQYSVNVVDIERWLRHQLINLRTTGQAKVENLSKWQVDEQQRLIELLLKKQQEMPYEQVERELTQDHARLQSLSHTHHVGINQVDQWMREELRRLQSSGLVQFEQQTQWQQKISNGFNDWLQQQRNGASYQEFVDFLKRDKQRLNGIASDYHVTIEQVEMWVQREAARLSIIGVIDRPQDNVKYEDISNIWVGDRSASWKNELLVRLRSVTLQRPFSRQEFESYLIRNKPIFEQIARQYHVTIEDIHFWLQNSASNEGLVTSPWQDKERLHIENLINQQQRKQQRWTIEELELLLENDQKHVQDAVAQYHVTVEELKAWYKNELNRQLQQRRIDRGPGLSWQAVELKRIYSTVKNTGKSRQLLENLLLRDVHLLAPQYQVNIEELQLFIQDKLRRFSNLGLIEDNEQQATNWHDQERTRLRKVAASVVITEQELLEFISHDTSFQKQMAQLYQVGLDQLAPVQRIFIRKMSLEQVLEQRRLNHLSSWQQRERDRLYEFIGNQNMTQAELISWQTQDSRLLQDFSQRYKISEQQLKDWQKQELGRINQLARYYGMSNSDLQQFREGELLHLASENHRILMSTADIQNWEKRHQWSLSRLQNRYGKLGEELVTWRRTLFLLSQGLIDLPSDNGGGYVIDLGSTNATAVYKPIFSKDRGDQPPHTYEETFVEGDEPGLEVEMTRSRPLHASPNVSTPVPYNKGGPVGGYEYQRQDYTFHVPVETASSSASASGGATGAPASASVTIGKWNRSAGDEPLQHVEDLGQQQQVEEVEWVEKLDDLGQQKQVEEPYWNQQLEDLGQHQAAIEDQYLPKSKNVLPQQQSKVQVETTAEPSFWEKLKGKLG